MSKAAKMSVMEELHAAVAKVLTDGLKVDHPDEVDPKLLDKALRFLKDNGIEPSPDADNSALDALASKVSDWEKTGEKPDDIPLN